MSLELVRWCCGVRTGSAGVSGEGEGEGERGDEELGRGRKGVGEGGRGRTMFWRVLSVVRGQFCAAER